MMSETESSNPKTTNLDLMTVKEIISVMIEEDKKVLQAVRSSRTQITECVNLMVRTIFNGGRIVYVGAGTSGRLGVLDAVECVPTFSISPEMFQGIIAGGREAMFRSIEGAEDDKEDGFKIAGDLLRSNDMLIGITSSGTTSFVFGALEKALDIGAKTSLITCNKYLEKQIYDIVIEVFTGPEILSGSTRLKAGTATKITLNMLSLTTMVKIGKVYRNLMVDLKVMNQKLYRRAIRIFREICHTDKKTAEKFLRNADMNLKVAIVMKHAGMKKTDAKSLLNLSGGQLRKIIE